MNSNGFFSSKCFGEETNIFRTWWTENSGENIRQAQNLRNKIMGHVKRTPPLLHSPHLHPSTLLSFLSSFFFPFYKTIFGHLYLTFSLFDCVRHLWWASILFCFFWTLWKLIFVIYSNISETRFCNIFLHTCGN